MIDNGYSRYIWQRAGGAISRLRLNGTGTGRAQWFSVLRTLEQGGGGENISIDSLNAKS